MIEIPAKLLKNHGERSAEWLAGLPGAAAEYIDRWELAVTGRPGTPRGGEIAIEPVLVAVADALLV